MVLEGRRSRSLAKRARGAQPAADAGARTALEAIVEGKPRERAWGVRLQMKPRAFRRSFRLRLLLEQDQRDRGTNRRHTDQRHDRRCDVISLQAVVGALVRDRTVILVGAVLVELRLRRLTQCEKHAGPGERANPGATDHVGNGAV